MEYLYEDTDIPFDMMRERLFLALEKGLKDFFIGDFWADVARGIFQRLFPLLKEQENRLRGEGFNPFMMEQNLRVKVNGLGLKGKVDRVDSRKLQIKNSQSQKDTRNPVVLLDYKTGAIDRDKEGDGSVHEGGTSEGRGHCREDQKGDVFSSTFS
jgi:hypothetical protein